jgi:sulfur transfer complex TusBCD TusB component (DsrH family)
MRHWLIVCALLFGAGLGTAEAGAPRILKTLPHRLDLQGRHTLSPSLYERDAYQDFLRSNPDQVSALRFDVQWRGRTGDKAALKLRLEVRSRQTEPGKAFVIEQPAQAKGWFSRWSAVEIDAAKLKELGDITAWRVSLWDGDQQLAEQKSFLW